MQTDICISDKADSSNETGADLRVTPSLWLYKQPNLTNSYAPNFVLWACLTFLQPCDTLANLRLPQGVHETYPHHAKRIVPLQSAQK